MKLAFVLFASCSLSLFGYQSDVLASDMDCRSAVEIFEDRVKAQPHNLLPFYIDSLQKNPGCRGDLLISAVRASDGDSRLIRWVIFVSRQEFPHKLTLLTGAAMTDVREWEEVIRETLFVEEAEMADLLLGADEASLSDAQSPIVELSEEAKKLDEDIREAIARINTKVEGKAWSDEGMVDTDFFRQQADTIFVSPGGWLDEHGMDNSLPIDMLDERIMLPMAIKIDDDWKPSEEVYLNESNLTKSSSNSRIAAAARKKELAPASAVGLPQGPKLARPELSETFSVGGDYSSTIDRDERDNIRPSLVIRSAPPLSASVRRVPATTAAD